MKSHEVTEAARIYSLALVANMDGGGAETHEQTRVVQRAIDRARTELARLGLDWAALPTLQACIDVAKRG